MNRWERYEGLPNLENMTDIGCRTISLKIFFWIIGEQDSFFFSKIHHTKAVKMESFKVMVKRLKILLHSVDIANEVPKVAWLSEPKQKK